MKTRIVAVLLMLSLIGAGMAMAGCQKGSSNNIVELTSSASDTSSEASDEPTSSEEASSTPELSVNSSGEVVDSKGEVVSGYEVSSTGDIISSSTGTVVVPASSANATSSTAAQAPAYSTSTTGSKPASSASKVPAAHTHSYTATVVKPTCTAQGYTTHKCSCGNSYQDSKTAALGHNYGDWVITKSATTTNEGTQTRTCSRCGATESQSIPKIVQTSKWDAAATPSNAKLVAERTLYYINEYRKAQGSSTATSLPNMTAYAEYRSRQLVTNFSHSATDERAAAAALQYGEYVDPSSWGASGREPYWQAGCGEAIAGPLMTGGTIDDIAKAFAKAARNSSGHWAYVGNTVNIYCSIGFTCSNNQWYCDICTTNTNQYG